MSAKMADKAASAKKVPAPAPKRGVAGTVVTAVLLVVVSIVAVDVLFPTLLPLPYHIHLPFSLALPFSLPFSLPSLPFSLPFALPFGLPFGLSLGAGKKSRAAVEADLVGLFHDFETPSVTRWNEFTGNLSEGAALYECGMLPWWAGGCPATHKGPKDVKAALQAVQAAYGPRGARCDTFASGRSYTSSAFWIKWGCSFSKTLTRGQSMSTSSTFYFYISETDKGAKVTAIMTPGLKSVAQS